MKRSACWAASAIALVACGVVREERFGEPRCPEFSTAIQPILGERCASCHSGPAPAAGYSVEGHLSVLSRRDDGSARLVPGDAQSAFPRAVRGELPDHSAVPEPQSSELRRWAVSCRAAPSDFKVHLNGWMSPPDPEEFHGRVLRRQGYALLGCRDCHGADLKGGQVHIGCDRCHPGGPLDCGVCHGDSTSAAPPRDLSGARATTSIGVGAHRRHVTDGPNHRAFDCTTCHEKPQAAEDEGHTLRGGQVDPAPAEVKLQATAGAEARWDRASATCSGTYCHSPRPADGRATNPSPRWTSVGEGQAACGACHGNPPEGHTDAACERCHRRAFAAGRPILGMHLNGTVEAGDAQGTCSGCHGDASSPAPPPDVRGETSESFATVGAHRSHLEARHSLRGPIECGECHLVPLELKSPGHIDSAAPAEVFPPGAGSLARADSASPSYDSATASCSSVYCHGGGTRHGKDTAPTKLPSPVWTAGVSQAVCGACHGIPPEDGSTFHPGKRLGDCVNCHSSSVTAGGSIKVARDANGNLTSTHLDGQVQTNP
ncbi:MAG: CxxxxCH/CxxCH domain-containing protein [Myxococcales bacterium]|nr:CxxxxCH/CxxCH domain-containing protein [Myxococcales bacterium]